MDLLLDAAALGTSYVEREGVSVRHAARFLLVGTMNPEEGELRPQLLDRFGLTVEVAAPRDPATRAEVVRRRLAFDADPGSVRRRLRRRGGRPGAGASTPPASACRRSRSGRGTASRSPRSAPLRGGRAAGRHRDRPDGRRARRLGGRDTVTSEDVREAARLALPHRRRRNPFDAPGLDEQQLDEALGDDEPDDDTDPSHPARGCRPRRATPRRTPTARPTQRRPSASARSRQHAATRRRAAGPRPRAVPGPGPRPGPGPGVAAGWPGDGHGERCDVPRPAPRGCRQADTGPPGDVPGPTPTAAGPCGATLPRAAPRDLHLLATLAAAAPHQARRGRTGPGLLIRDADLRERRREGRESNLVLFLVDASGSMAARRRMAAVKGAVLSLLLDAYQRRDKVGLICFRGNGAQVLLPPTSSVDAAARRLEIMPAGGRTPLAAGLAEAHATLARERLRDPRRRPLLVIVTDGRHTAGGDPAVAAARLRRDNTGCVVVDCESGPVRLGLAAALASNLGAQHLTLDDLGGLSAGALADSVRTYRANTVRANTVRKAA